MSVKDFILILSLCSCQVCDSAQCDLYENSDIHRDCLKSEVEHGIVCYTRFYNTRNWPFWKENVTCQEGFHLVTSSSRICYYSDSGTKGYFWSPKTRLSTCEQVNKPSTKKSTISTITKPPPSSSTTGIETKTIKATNGNRTVFDDNNKDNSDNSLDKQDESRLVVVYVTVPIVIVLLIAVTLFVIYRRWKVSGNCGPNCQNGTESSVTNRENYYPVDNTENHSGIIDANDSEYVYIAVSETEPNTIGDSEYNTLHENALRNNCQNYHHIRVPPDTYAHTTSSCSNVQSDKDTYSHVYNANHGQGRSGLNTSTETGNIYNKLHIDDRNKLEEFDSTSIDPDYDHANIHSGVPASIERDTYDHVTNGVDEDDGDYAICHEYDDNFVSEK